MSKRYLLGLLGHPVKQSISPVIHRALLKSAGLDGAYELHDIESNKLDLFFEKVKKLNYSGLNVTIPHKLKVMDYVDCLSSEALVVGAINTIRFDADKNCIFGYNTDVVGFKRALCLLRKKTCSVLVYGYGGSSRAVLVALAELGYDNIYVTGRSVDRAQEFVSNIRPQIEKIRKTCQVRKFDCNLHIASIGLLVNCSPIGQNNIDVTDSFSSCLAGMAGTSNEVSQKMVIDLVYSKDRNEHTKVVLLAKEYGMEACDGYEMLIHQALESFELWTGHKIERASLEAHL